MYGNREKTTTCIGIKYIVELDVLNSLNKSLESVQKGGFLLVLVLVLVLTRVEGKDKLIVVKALEAATKEMAINSLCATLINK